MSIWGVFWRFPPAARRTIQNYVVWRLVLDRISSLSQRYKNARANYHKVRGPRASGQRPPTTPAVRLGPRAPAGAEVMGSEPRRSGAAGSRAASKREVCRLSARESDQRAGRAPLGGDTGDLGAQKR